jgi:hypothetical protein
MPTPHTSGARLPRHSPKAKKAPAQLKKSKNGRVSCGRSGSRSTGSKTAPGAESKTKRLRRCTPGPAIHIGAALREIGLDEHRIAKSYRHAVDLLTKPNAEAGSAEKLLIEILKECSRQVESFQALERLPIGARPVIVQLVHSVPRPPRLMSANPPAVPAPEAALPAVETDAATPAAGEIAPSS